MNIRQRTANAPSKLSTLKAEVIALTLKVAELENRIDQLTTPKPRGGDVLADKPVKVAAISVPTAIWNQSAREFCAAHPKFSNFADGVEKPDNRAICEALADLKFRAITARNIRQAFDELDSQERGEAF